MPLTPEEIAKFDEYMRLRGLPDHAHVNDKVQHSDLLGLAIGDDHTQYLENVVEDTTPQLGGDLDLNSKNIDFPSTANISDCKDEDDMASDSATMLATQQSIKKYVDDNKGQHHAAQMTTVTATGADTTDRTITTGFQPSYIELLWYAQGYTADGSDYLVAQGRALFTGTTLTFNMWYGEGNNGANEDDNLAHTALDFKQPNQTDALKYGQDTSGAFKGLAMEITINSVSSTGFVIRCQTTEAPAGAEGTARARVDYIALS